MQFPYYLTTISSPIFSAGDSDIGTYDTYASYMQKEKYDDPHHIAVYHMHRREKKIGTLEVYVARFILLRFRRTNYVHIIYVTSCSAGSWI